MSEYDSDEQDQAILDRHKLRLQEAASKYSIELESEKSSRNKKHIDFDDLDDEDLARDDNSKIDQSLTKYDNPFERQDKPSNFMHLIKILTILFMQLFGIV